MTTLHWHSWHTLARRPTPVNGRQAGLQKRPSPRHQSNNGRLQISYKSKKKQTRTAESGGEGTQKSANPEGQPRGKETGFYVRDLPRRGFGPAKSPGQALLRTHAKDTLAVPKHRTPYNFVSSPAMAVRFQMQYATAHSSGSNTPAKATSKMNSALQTLSHAQLILCAVFCCYALPALSTFAKHLRELFAQLAKAASPAAQSLRAAESVLRSWNLTSAMNAMATNQVLYTPFRSAALAVMALCAGGWRRALEDRLKSVATLSDRGQREQLLKAAVNAVKVRVPKLHRCTAADLLLIPSLAASCCATAIAITVMMVSYAYM